MLLTLLFLSLLAVLAVRIAQHRELFDELVSRPRAERLELAKYRPLVDKLGPPLYSKRGEELIIRDWFKDRRGGFFLDVGASHHRINSNTYYLEEHLDWQGIAVDALAEYEYGYVKHRPATRYFTFFVSDQSDERAAFFVHRSNKRLSTGQAWLAESWEHEESKTPTVEGWSPEEIEVPTITLNDLLDHAGIASIDLLSMDIEMWEPKALAGFDIERFAPELVCIEAHPEVREAISAYFADHGYQRIEKYLEFDPGNWYFRRKT